MQNSLASRSIIRSKRLIFSVKSAGSLLTDVKKRWVGKTPETSPPRSIQLSGHFTLGPSSFVSGSRGRWWTGSPLPDLLRALLAGYKADHPSLRPILPGLTPWPWLRPLPPPSAKIQFSIGESGERRYSSFNQWTADSSVR